MCWKGQGNHVNIVSEMHLQVFEEGKRKEKDISRREKIMSKDSQVEKNMSNSKILR